MKDPFGSFVSSSDDKCLIRISETLSGRGWSIAHPGLKPRHRGFPHPPPWPGQPLGTQGGQSRGWPSPLEAQQSDQADPPLPQRQGGVRCGTGQARYGVARPGPRPSFSIGRELGFTVRRVQTGLAEVGLGTVEPGRSSPLTDAIVSLVESVLLHPRVCRCDTHPIQYSELESREGDMGQCAIQLSPGQGRFRCCNLHEALAVA